MLEVARVTEAAAIAAAQLRGRGNEKAADKAAVDAMRRELGARRDQTAPSSSAKARWTRRRCSIIGEKVGTGEGPEVDIAVDPLEGTTICAKAMPNALAVLAISERGGLLHAPDMYMNKIAIGPGYPEGIVDLDATPAENLTRARQGQRRADRRDHGLHPRSAAARRTDQGRARSRRRRAAHSRRRYRGRHLDDRSEETGIDIYMGSGGAPEGVLAAAALRCIGGQIQGRLMPMKDEERVRAEKMGITDIKRKFKLEDMASADVVFSATGVTDGSLLKGVRIRGDFAETETVVMRSKTGTVRRIKSTLRNVGARFI